MTQQQYKIFSLLIVLAICSWLLANLFEQDEVIKVTVTDNSPLYISKGYYKKEMNLQGLIKSELNADKVTYYNEGGTSHFENPVMTLYNDNASPWVIKSEAGVSENNGEHLKLTGSVSINRSASQTSNALQINTSNLRVTPKINYAETNEWAEIINDTQITEGIGLQATFVNPLKLKFLSNVKGRYEIN